MHCPCCLPLLLPRLFPPPSSPPLPQVSAATGAVQLGLMRADLESSKAKAADPPKFKSALLQVGWGAMGGLDDWCRWDNWCRWVGALLVDWMLGVGWFAASNCRVYVTGLGCC
jgi:hypothetical protein